YLPRGIVRPVFVGTAVLFSETALLAVGGTINTTAAGLQSIVNIEESSVLLFTFFELAAILPLVAGLSVLQGRRETATPVGGPAPMREPVASSPRIRPPGRRARTVVALLACLVISVPLGTGTLVTAVQAPGYIDTHIGQLANVTPADISALEWSGENLPSCSRVLVAPGSVGQYLPEYAAVALVFPAFPTPSNLSYQRIVQSLDGGTYDNATRALLIGLEVTTVFVSGQNSVSYLPFLLPPLRASPDFAVLFSSGDAAVLTFEPGATEAHCLP
ncbi:MAG: hypothetical protein ACREEC_07280, partial [Thermoplasmata archaeon]